MFTIVTDTSANLPTPLAKEAGLFVLPFTYTIDGKTYAAEDTESFDGVSFYEKIRRGMLVTTSLINTQTYLDHFTPLAESGQDIQNDLLTHEEYELLSRIVLQKYTISATAKELGISIESCRKKVRLIKQKLRKNRQSNQTTNSGGRTAKGKEAET